MTDSVDHVKNVPYGIFLTASVVSVRNFSTVPDVQVKIFLTATMVSVYFFFDGIMDSEKK